MTSDHAQDGLTGCRPILRAANVARSIEYYVGALGFGLAMAWSDDEQRFLCPLDTARPTFAILGRERVQLMLAEREQGVPGMWLHLDMDTADGLDALHANWASRGAEIFEPPKLRNWGMYEMRVRDPDGHVLRVSAPPRPAGQAG